MNSTVLTKQEIWLEVEAVAADRAVQLHQNLRNHERTCLLCLTVEKNLQMWSQHIVMQQYVPELTRSLSAEAWELRYAYPSEQGANFSICFCRELSFSTKAEEEGNDLCQDSNECSVIELL